MRSALVVVFGLSVLTSCGATPVETAYAVKVYNAWCDVLHKTLTDTQKNNVPYDFYLGANAGDCKAAFNDQIADVADQAFGERKLVTAEADKCIEGIGKLAAADVVLLMAGRVKIASVGTSDLQKTARDAAFATLGVSTTTMFGPCKADQTTCSASPGCALATTNGPCALYKIAPLKDGNLAGKESEGYTGTGGSVIGCGQMWGI